MLVWLLEMLVWLLRGILCVCVRACVIDVCGWSIAMMLCWVVSFSVSTGFQQRISAEDFIRWFQQMISSEDFIRGLSEDFSQHRISAEDFSRGVQQRISADCFCRGFHQRISADYFSGGFHTADDFSRRFQQMLVRNDDVWNYVCSMNSNSNVKNHMLNYRCRINDRFRSW